MMMVGADMMGYEDAKEVARREKNAQKYEHQLGLWMVGFNGSVCSLEEEMFVKVRRK